MAVTAKAASSHRTSRSTISRRVPPKSVSKDALAKHLATQIAASGHDFWQSGTGAFWSGQHGMPSDMPDISAIPPIAADGLAIGARMRPTTAKTQSRREKVFKNCTWPFFHFARREKRSSFANPVMPAAIVGKVSSATTQVEGPLLEWRRAVRTERLMVSLFIFGSLIVAASCANAASQLLLKKSVSIKYKNSYKILTLNTNIDLSLLFVAALCFAVSISIYMYLLRHHDVSIVFSSMALTQVLVYALSRLVLREKASSYRRALGTAAIAIGLGLMVASDISP